MWRNMYFLYCWIEGKLRTIPRLIFLLTGFISLSAEHWVTEATNLKYPRTLFKKVEKKWIRRTFLHGKVLKTYKRSRPLDALLPIMQHRSSVDNCWMCMKWCTDATYILTSWGINSRGKRSKWVNVHRKLMAKKYIYIYI